MFISPRFRVYGGLNIELDENRPGGRHISDLDKSTPRYIYTVSSGTREVHDEISSTIVDQPNCLVTGSKASPVPTYPIYPRARCNPVN